jgi:hypothetical protein
VIPKYFSTVGAGSMIRGSLVLIGRLLTKMPDVIA